MATNPTDARLFIRKVFYTVAHSATAFCRIYVKKTNTHTQARIVVALVHMRLGNCALHKLCK